MKAGVIGAGIGGLAIASLLANDGYEVDIYEKNDTPGGKLNQVVTQGYQFDTGPSLLTMPYIIEQLFAICEKDVNDYLTIEPLDLLCRYFYPDGTIFNCYKDIDKTVNEIKKFAPEDSGHYAPFLKYAENLYDRTSTSFLLNPLSKWSDFLGLSYLDILRIDSFHTVSERVEHFFESSYMRQFFKRFTTYNGSSPYKAPATLNVIPHVELSMGGYYIRGGMYQLAQALHKLAIDSGVTFHFNTTVQSIEAVKDRKHHIITNRDSQNQYDLVVSNSDATETYLKLLNRPKLSAKKRNKIQRQEPSCSGFVLLLGCNKEFSQLEHHNIFFSPDYENEFHQIFDKQTAAENPTIYVTNTSLKDSELSPKNHSNLFVLVNAPYLSDKISWSDYKEEYASKIINILEDRGLNNLRQSIEIKEIITPEDFYNKYLSNRGSIYGTSSNSKWAAFNRPKNKSPYIKNLYLVGGSTHPGGGIPLVILSAFHAWRLINRDHR